MLKLLNQSFYPDLTRSFFSPSGSAFIFFGSLSRLQRLPYAHTDLHTKYVKDAVPRKDVPFAGYAELAISSIAVVETKFQDGIPANGHPS